MIPELHQDIVSFIGRHTTLKKVAANEYAGPCPVCGGTDRLRVSDKKGWFCRKCQGEPGSGGHWGDIADFTAAAFGWTLRDTLRHFNLDRQASPEEIERMETERRKREAQERQAEQEQQASVHAALSGSPDWQTYHQHPQTPEKWQERGLSPAWVKYYGLGYCPTRRHAHDGKWFESDSLTIPYFRPTFTQHQEGGADVTWRLVGLQHRLLMDNAPGGKYRPHMAGAGKHLFYTDVFTQNIIGDLLIVEGEIKAMVTWSALWEGEIPLAPNLSVVGVAGKSWKPDWLEQFRKAERVWVCLDPDATESARRLASTIGENARVILLPEKIDDLINIGVLDGYKLIEILEMSNG